MNIKRRMAVRHSPIQGFTTFELMIVLGIGLIIMAIGLPSFTKTQALYRASGDGRSIAETLTLAKMRAGANFTKARVVFNPADSTYQLEKYNKTTNNYEIDGGVKNLSTGVAFGYGSIGTPAGSQTTITQSPIMIFNSRGIPVDNSNQPTADYAVYFNNSTGYYAVSVALSGRVQVWRNTPSGWVAQ